MRVVCPKCEAKFKVPDKALGTKGRKLKCASCEHQWHQDPPPKKKPKPAAEAAAPADDGELKMGFGEGEGVDAVSDEEAQSYAEEGAEEMAPPPISRPSRFGRKPVEKKKRKLLVPALLGIAVLIPVILLAAKGTLVHAWPASALLYDKLGMGVPVPGEGLVLQNVYVQRRMEGQLEVLLLEGEVRNPNETQMSIPAIKATLMDADGQPLEHWLVQPDVYVLTPGETVTFASKYATDYQEASQANVTFTNERPEAGLGY